MGREVRTFMGDMDKRSPYYNFIAERNGNIAKHIAQHQGLPFNPAPLMDMAMEKTYVVPGKTMSTLIAEQLLIENENDLYGAVAPSLDYVGKSVLHPTLTIATPPFYDLKFAMRAQESGLVLPGYTCFSPDEVKQAYELMGSKQNKYRLKTPNDSDGNGQYLVRDNEHLKSILFDMSPQEVINHGVVLEPNLENKVTVSAGVFNVGAEPYAFVANQVGKADDKRDVFLGGSNIIVTRGGLAQLTTLLSRRGDNRNSAVTTAQKFLELYMEHYPILASRISVDVLEGTHSEYGKLDGVTDITPRLGGFCSATILAALNLLENPSYEAVVAQVNLNYSPHIAQPYEKGATIFLNQALLRISAKIDEVI